MNGVCHGQGQNNCRSNPRGRGHGNAQPASHAHAGTRGKKDYNKCNQGAGVGPEGDANNDDQRQKHKWNEGFQVVFCRFGKGGVKHNRPGQIEVDPWIFLAEIIYQFSSVISHFLHFSA